MKVFRRREGVDYEPDREMEGEDERHEAEVRQAVEAAAQELEELFRANGAPGMYREGME